MTDKRYGYAISGEAYGLADFVYGHRFWDSQTATEYMLEFLSVLVGFKYDLSRHVDPSVPEDQREELVEYTRLKRIGLRRFVFYSDERKSTDIRDTEALRRLEQRLRETVSADPEGGDALGPLRTFLRSFSAVERTRSWYAKSLFPAHENFLYWEGLRKNAGKTAAPGANASDLSASALDQGFTVGDRNFFARGGEMVYLMLGAGTAGAPKTRQFIEVRLKNLLQEDTRAGQVAALVEDAWQALIAEENDATVAARAAEGLGHYEAEPAARVGTLGWLPDASFPTYSVFAQDVAALLRCKLDHVELFHLLSHLISFHVVEYLYTRAYQTCKEVGPDGVPRPIMLIDAVDVGEGRAIRYASGLIYKRNQEMLFKAAQTYVEELANTCVPSADPWTRMLELFGGTKPGKKQKVTLDQQAAKVAQAIMTGDHEAIVGSLTAAIMAVYDDQFHKRFLPVHRRLAKEIGLVAPHTGTSQRYVIGDALLKALVLANVTRDVEFHSFVELLFDRYGLLIGPEQLHRAPWVRDYDINNQYYQANMDAFRRKLKHTGLLTEYSDATALVHNRAAQQAGEVDDIDA